MRNKIIIITISFSIILIGAVILSQNYERKVEIEPQKNTANDITQDWAIHNNVEYDFLFKHPKFCEIGLKEENETYYINCPRHENDIYNFIMFTPQKNNLTFDQYLSEERNNCLQWLNEFSNDDKNAKDDIVVKTDNGIKAIINVSSCGHNVGAPTELWLFNKNEDVVVNFVGDIFIDETNITSKIIDSFKFIEKIPK